MRAQGQTGSLMEILRGHLLGDRVCDAPGAGWTEPRARAVRPGSGRVSPDAGGNMETSRRTGGSVGRVRCEERGTEDGEREGGRQRQRWGRDREIKIEKKPLLPKTYLESKCTPVGITNTSAIVKHNPQTQSLLNENIRASSRGGFSSSETKGR